MSVPTESSKSVGPSAVRAVDLFCGIGGLTHGLRAAGIDVGVGIDADAFYWRLRWDESARTITTQFCYCSTGRFGHPDQDRTISIREGVLLQTFPRDYSFTDGPSFPLVRKLARHIGNAVPVVLASTIGEATVEASHVH